MTQIVNHYFLIICTIIALTNAGCISIWNDVDEPILSTNIISYLDYGSDEVDRVDIRGYINMNNSQHVSEIPNNFSYTNIYTIYILKDISLLGDFDMSELFKAAQENGYTGFIISASSSKLPGEPRYFYFTDTTHYDIKSFDVRQEYLSAASTLFPNGAHFEIKKTEDCDPYFNYWTDFFTGFFFHFFWIIAIISAVLVLVYMFYTMSVKWEYITLIFKLCFSLYTISLILQIATGVLFIVAKYYRQGDLVYIFQVSDILGAVVSYSFSLAGLILYISNFHLSITTGIVDLSEAKRTIALIASLAMCVFSVVGVLVLVLAESSIVYYVCFLYYIVMLFSAIVYYVRVNLIFLSIFVNLPSSNPRRKKVDRLFNNTLVQNVMLILIVLTSITTFYIISPVQTSLAPCLIRVFFNVVMLMQLLNLKTAGKKSTSNSKANSGTEKAGDTLDNEDIP